MSAFLCVCVYMYVRAYVFEYAACMRVCVWVCYWLLCVFVNANMYVGVCVCAFMCVRV